MKVLYALIILLTVSNSSLAQGKFLLKGNAKSDKINFKLINNLIVFPVEINGVKLSFLLDTGVSKPIIFNALEDTKGLEIKNKETILLRGLGGGESIEAIKSSKNLFKIGDALNVNQTIYQIYDNSLDFAPRLGVPVHGIMGYDLFRDFVIEVNYSKKYIKLYDPNQFTMDTCKKCEEFDLEFHNMKPYINAKIETNGKKTPVKLLIDSGGSDALWLFDDESKGISLPEVYFNDFLGYGLSGSIHGKRSKIEKLHLKSFVFSDVNVAYPDSTSIFHARKFKARNGSIAGELLKRFNAIYDYNGSKVYLKKNSAFKKPFLYNKSGISIEYGDVRLVKEKVNKRSDDAYLDDTRGSVPIIVVTTYKYSFKPAFTVVELRPDSPAQRAGIQINDVILSINNKPSYEFTLQEMIQNFYGHDGKKIRLKIDRNGQILDIKFELESLLKQKSSSD